LIPELWFLRPQVLKKYHYAYCSSWKRITLANQIWFASDKEAEAAGYTLAATARNKKATYLEEARGLDRSHAVMTLMERVAINPITAVLLEGVILVVYYPFKKMYPSKKMHHPK